MNTILDNIKEHAFTTGLISSTSSVGFGLVGLLSQEATVRVIGSIGGLLGIVLTCVSIYFTFKKGLKK